VDYLPRDPRQTVLDEFYTTGEGAQYLDPSSENYIPGMENYNIVSGSDTLNKLTGGRIDRRNNLWTRRSISR
jgi:hypothetical protein